MGLILNLETATTNCSVSLAENGKILTIKEDNSPNYSHAEQLHLFIQDCLDEIGKSVEDLDAVAISKGPGSYTGLRIGVSAAKGLCFTLDIPLISIATLKSMASQVHAKPGELIIPVLDARRMEVYAAVFNADLNQIRDTEAKIINENSLEEFYTGHIVHVVGSGAEKIKKLLSSNNLIFDVNVIPSSKEMAKLSYQKYKAHSFEDVAYFEPYYLKDFILQKSNKK